jgi:iron complex outermembrane recepter protein
MKSPDRSACAARRPIYALAASCIVFFDAAAQGTPPADAAPAPEATTALPAVTVTGSAERPLVRKAGSVGILGERPLLDTPFSIQSYSRELLDAQGSRTLYEAVRSDAGVKNNLNAGGYATAVSIRGFDTFNATWDGLLGPAHYYQDFPLEIVEAVEVFKGPAALLFGGGNLASPAGSVNYLPKRAPTDGGPLRRVALGTQTGGASFAHADLGGRAGDAGNFGWRFNAYGRKGGLALDKVDLSERALVGAFDWRATDTLSFTVDLGSIRSRKDGYTDVYALAPGVAIPPPPEGRVNVALPWAKWTADRDFAVLKADWALTPGWSLGVAATHTKMDFSYLSAGFISIEDSAGNGTISANEFGPFTVTKTALSARLKGRFEALGAKHELTLSAIDDKESQVDAEYRDLGLYATNIYRPVDAPRPAASTLIAPYPAYDVKVRTVQALDTIELSPRWTAMLGVARIRIDTTEAAFPPAYSAQQTTPLASLLFKPHPAVSLYASYAEGFEPGGTAPPTATANAGEKLPPRTTEQFEVGAKAQWGRMQLAAAAFRIDRALEYLDASGRYVQDGRQRHDGMELSASGRVVPALNLIASAMLLRPTVNNGDPAINGKRATGVPERSVSLYADWRLPIGVPLSLSAGAQYKSAQWFDLANTQRIGAYTVYDLGASLDLTRWLDVAGTLRLNIDNVADKAYWSSVSYGCCLARGEPRTVKLAASFEF